MKEAIEKVSSNPLAVPDYLKDVTGHEGLEHVRQTDLVLPQVKFCQSLSPEKTRSDSKYIQGLEEGQLFNNLTQENYGTTLDIIPLIYKPAPRILWRKREEGGGMLCQSANGVNGGTVCETCAECPNSKSSVDDKGKFVPPKCTEYMTFACLVRETQDLITIPLKSSALKKGRAWVTRGQMLNKPFYSQVYKLDLVAEKGEKGPYYAPKFTFKGFVNPEELAFAKATYDSIKGATIKTDLEENDADEGEERTPF